MIFPTGTFYLASVVNSSTVKQNLTLSMGAKTLEIEVFEFIPLGHHDHYMGAVAHIIGIVTIGHFAKDLS